MLVCPYCQFENPDHNKFCQSCGNTLRAWQAVITLSRKSQTCEQREQMANQVLKLPTDFSVDAEIDQLASTLPLTESRSVEGESSKQRFNPSETSNQSDFKGPTAFAIGDNLDPKQRYQLTEPLPTLLNPATEIEIGVIDRCPADPSPLENIHEKLLGAATAAESLDAFVMAGLPTSAQPYLLLQHRLFPALPELHDAWQDDDHTVLILEDRLLLPLLSDFWKRNDIEPLQQVHWLYEMTELWEALAVWEGQISLINLENLRVDEDHILCLRRLYFQPSGSTYSLKDLGLFWQSLLQQSQDLPLEALITLANRLGNQEINTIEEVQSCLAKIADGLQVGDIDSAIADKDYNPAATATVSETVSSTPVESSLNSPVSELAFILPDQGRSDQIDNEAELSQLDFDELDEETIDSGNATDLPTMVLPMKLVGLEEEGRTHIGRQRDHNEDTFCILTELKRQESPEGQTLNARGLYILCDGMGGHAEGEIASALAAKTLQAYFKQHWQDQLPSEDSIREAIGLANQAIYEINQQDDRSGSGRMGTTLVMALFQDTRVIVAHVGDSRLYRFSRRLGLQQVTVDHEVGQREIQRGVEPAIAYARPDAYQLTQALGPRNQTEIKPSISFLDLSEDTLLILCSDGLSDNGLLETYCDSHVEPLLGSRFILEEGVSKLIELANEINGHDNITAIAARIRVRPNLEKIKPSQ